MAKRSSPSLRRVFATTTIALAVVFSGSVVVDCSEVKDDAAAIPDGGREGWTPPAPRPGTVRHMCPDPEPECGHPGAGGGAPPPPPPAPHRKVGRSG
ncbi:formin-G-like [Panicum virgatum]|uniref:formin-G-like n=1 Tax=Panicum virgatum TaxID=38727 RepID=UPI0019D641AF|nr:formin-G-like [Panicum virgatum]